jgi:hypothetical protein
LQRVLARRRQNSSDVILRLVKISMPRSGLNKRVAALRYVRSTLTLSKPSKG